MLNKISNDATHTTPRRIYRLTQQKISFEYLVLPLPKRVGKRKKLLIISSSNSSQILLSVVVFFEKILGIHWSQHNSFFILLVVLIKKKFSCLCVSSLCQLKTGKRYFLFR